MPSRLDLPRFAAGLCLAALLALSATSRAQDAFQQGLDAYLEGNYQAARELWVPAAESGDPVAAFNVGVLYAQGLGVEADQAEAVRWYRMSAHAGYANAQFNLGAVYYNGDGTEVNVAQALSWWEQAAQQDHPEAVYNLGTLYRRGEGVQQDLRRARALFERAASLGDSRAQQALTDLASEPPASAAAGEGGQAPESNPEPSDGSLAGEDPEHWTVQVFAGADPKAAQAFARRHGLRGELRIYEARVDGKTWFKGVYGSFADRAGAESAEAELQRKLRDADPWVRSFRAIQAELIAEHPVVAETAGNATEDSPESGEAAPSRPETAASLEAAPDGGGNQAAREPDPAGDPETGEDAGSDGQAEADRAEGDRAALSRGQKAFNAQNYAAALEIWRPLAEKGLAEAQYGIGFMYESGWGVDRDYDRAFQWYQQAAEQGHVKSQYNLGMLYRNGQGVARNDALGLYWIQSAADRGDERAVNYLKNLN